MLTGSDKREHKPVPFHLGPSRFSIGENTFLYTDVAFLRLATDKKGAPSTLQLFTKGDEEYHWLVDGRQHHAIEWVLNQIRRRVQRLDEGEVPEELKRIRSEQVQRKV